MRVPAHAAISETVEMVRKHCGEKVVGFANGILRTISKQSFDQWITEITEGLSEVEKLSLKYSHPVWIVQALKQSLVSDGIAAELESLLATNNQPASVNLLALPGLAERAEYQDVAENNLHSPYGFHIKSGNPAELRGFAERYIRVQDEGSQLAALSLLEGKPVVAGELWLDMCAGPGGKAAFLAAMAKQRGVQLVANELQEHRADLVRDALSNFPESAKVSNFDGREIGKSMPDKFDRILVDAPCSGLGALRRRPEARWRKSNEDLKQLTALQFELIESVSKALKPGGILLYVTCSPHLSETTAIIDRARRQLPLEVLDLTQSINEKYLQGALPSGRKTVQLHTQRDNTDSMFMALMTKPE
jgi:16S rRNA (cytosine967-C5)-methyltransferase